MKKNHKISFRFTLEQKERHDDFFNEIRKRLADNPTASQLIRACNIAVTTTPKIREIVIKKIIEILQKSP